jgi:hypothetical protein
MLFFRIDPWAIIMSVDSKQIGLIPQVADYSGDPPLPIGNLFGHG